MILPRGDWDRLLLVPSSHCSHAYCAKCIYDEKLYTSMKHSLFIQDQLHKIHSPSFADYLQDITQLLMLKNYKSHQNILISVPHRCLACLTRPFITVIFDSNLKLRFLSFQHLFLSHHRVGFIGLRLHYL